MKCINPLSFMLTLHSLVNSFTQFIPPSCTPPSLQECVDMTDKGGGELSEERRESLSCSL